MLYNQDGSLHIPFPNNAQQAVLSSCAVYPFAAAKPPLGNFPARDQALSQWLNTLQTIGYPQLVENCVRPQPPASIPALAYTLPTPPNPSEAYHSAAPVSSSHLSEVVEQEEEEEECEQAAGQLYDESSFLVPLVQDPSPASYQKDFWSSDGYVDPYERVSGQTPNTVLRSCRRTEHKSSRFHSLSDPSRSHPATANSTDPVYTAVMKQNRSPAAPFNLEGRIEACNDDRSRKQCQGPNAPKPSQIAAAAAAAASSHPGVAVFKPHYASEPQQAASHMSELDSQAAQPSTNDRIAIATGTEGRSGCERGECVSQDGRDDERVSQDMKTEDDPLAQSTDAKHVSREVMKLMNIDMKWQSTSQQSGSRRSARNKSAVVAEVEKRPSVSTKKVMEQEVAVTPQPAAATRNSGRAQNPTPQQAPMQRGSAEDEERERLLPAQPAAVLHLAIALRRDANMQRESGTISKRMLTCGLLCGQPVHYHRASKNFACSGWIGSAATILCDCKNCKGKAEVSLTLFEIHAGSAYKRPTEGIFLTNFGVSLKDLSIIVQLLNEEDSLESGPCVNCSDDAAADVRCFGCLSSFHSGCITGSRPARAGAIWFCERCVQAQQTADYIPPNTAYKLLLTHGSSSPSAATSAPTPKRPRLAAEASGNKSLSMGAKAVSISSKQVKVRMTLMAPSQRSRSMARAHQTRVNRHKHLFAPEAGVLQDGEQLRYIAGGQVLLTGMAVIRGDVRGIHCDHCKEVISPSAFEYHAGRGQARKPYDNIYIDDDVPLTRVAQHRGVELPEENEMPYTAKASSFPNRRVRRRPKRDAEESDVEDEEEEEEDGTVQQIMDDTLGTGCALCQQRDFQKGGFGDRTIMICDQCEREYHVGCLREHGLCDLQALPEGDWFCSGQCEKIRTRLNAQVKAGDAPIHDAHSWHLMRGKDGNPATTKDLKIVHEILQGSFDPIIDQVSGKDLLPKMIYAQSFGEWDYTGMYAMLLRHKGKPVCSAIFRVFGDMLAELPLIATRHDARRKGHCRVLLNALETLLKEAGVRNLTMPAAHETVATWKGGFGFLSISPELQQLTEEDVRILVFPGTEMLSKELIPSSSTSPNSNTTSVPPSRMILANHHLDTTPAPAAAEMVITAPAGQQHNPYRDASTMHQMDALTAAGTPGPPAPADNHVPDAPSALLPHAAKSSNLDREVHSQHKRRRSNDEDDVADEAGGKRSRLSLSGKSTETTIKTERTHMPLSHMPGTNGTSHAHAPDSMAPSHPYPQHMTIPSSIQASHSNLHVQQHPAQLDSNSPVENPGSNLSASSTVVLAPVVRVQSQAHGDISKEVSSAAGHSTGPPEHREHANASHHTTAEQTTSPTDSERPSKRPCTNTGHHGNTHQPVTFSRDTPTQVGQYGTHSMTHPPGLMPAALPDSIQQAASNGGVFNMPGMQQLPGMRIHPHGCVTSAAHPLYHAGMAQHASSLSAFLSQGHAGPDSMVHSQHPAPQALPGALQSPAHAKSVPQGSNGIDVSLSNGGGKAFDERFSSGGQYASGNMAQSLGGLPKNTPWAFLSGNGSPPGTSQGKQRGSDSGTTLRKSSSNG